MGQVSSWERRIGTRHEVDLPAVRWDLGDRTAGPGTGVIVDLSVSGASIVARKDERLRPDMSVVIGYQDVQGTVVVRRVEESPDPARSRYAVEFTSTEPELTDALYRLLEKADDLEATWNGRYVD